MSYNWLTGGLLRAGRQFRTATSGSVAITFAVAAVLMMLATLGVVQYGLAVSARTKLNAVADAAALQAVSPLAVGTYLINGAINVAQTTATNMFNAQAAAVPGVTITALNITIVPGSTAAYNAGNGFLTATVSYTATLSSIAAGILGGNFTQVSGTSVATSAGPAFSNFYFLLDGSPSMGIGSTPQNISTMEAENGGCAFACHSPDATPQNYPGYTVPNVPDSMLRIGALQSAMSLVAQNVINFNVVPNQYQIGIYSFTNTVTTITPLTPNLSEVQSDIGNLMLPTSNLGTQIADAVDWLNNNVVTMNSGKGTPNSPSLFVFLVTDGVEDHVYGYSPGPDDTLTPPLGYWGGVPVTSVMDPSACTNLKNKGVTVAVVYTSYDPLDDPAGRYSALVAPFQPNIASALQACASPNFFIQADSAGEIASAIQQMLFAAIQQSTPRLTQ
jgi:Flp pilus assembly protein TadG